MSTFLVDIHSGYVTNDKIYKQIGDILLDGEALYFALENEVFYIIYELSDDIDTDTWHFTLPNGSEWRVVFLSNKDPDFNPNKKELRFDNVTAQKIIQDENLITE